MANSLRSVGRWASAGGFAAGELEAEFPLAAGGLPDLFEGLDLADLGALDMRTSGSGNRRSGGMS